MPAGSRMAADHEEIQLVDIVDVDDATQLIVAVRHLDHSAAGLLEDALHGGNHLLE